MGKPTPNYFLSILSMNCPRCRRGKVFRTPNPWNFKKTFDINDECPVCKQQFDMEPGFWYGTAYVSYALTVAFSVSTFVAWWVLIGFSLEDNRIFWWLGTNAVLMILLQPWFMRLSRTIWLSFFVKYDKEYDTNPPKTFKHHSS